MRLIKILCLTFLISLTSCYSTKRLIRENNFKPSDFDKQKLSGIYDSGQNDSLPKNLWNILKTSYSFKSDSLGNHNDKVKLTLLDDKNVNVKLLNSLNGNVIEEFNLKGKIKDEFFAIDRNLTLFPFFPVFYVNKESKIIIGNDLNGDLILVLAFED